MAEPLTVPDAAPQAIRSTSHGSRVRELLALYQETLDTADDLPLVPMVLRKHGGRLHYLPHPKWLLRYFLVGHVRRSLSGLSRRYSARAALGQQADGEQQDRDAVREFQESLPPARHKVYLVLLIAAIVVIFRPIINIAVLVAVLVITTLITAAKTQAAVPRWLGGRASVSADFEHLRQQALETLNTAETALNANVTAIDRALTAVLTGGFLNFAVVTLGVALSAYVALLPFGPGFRLKRMLFNLAPEPKASQRSAVARWSVSQATGLYEREHRVFAELGARPPKEFPFDLAVPALAMALPLASCGLLFLVGDIAFSEHRATAGWFAILGMAGLLTPILVGVGWLCRTWQRRRLGRSGPYMPFEVGIRNGTTVAKVESPIGWRLLVFLLFFLLGAGTGMLSAISEGRGPVYAFENTLAGGWFYSLPPALLVILPWWYRMNRELRDLDGLSDSHKTGIRSRVFLRVFLREITRRRGRLIWLVLAAPYWLTTLFVVALFAGLLLAFAVLVSSLFVPFILFFAALSVGAHIHRAQARAGYPRTRWSPWVLALGLLLSPVLFAYLQRELNKIWAVEGKPLDPWPAESSSEANCSTGNLPWLKGKRSND
jgi:hypothetical protein